MNFLVTSQRNLPSRRTVAYVLALVLPFLSAYITRNVTLLHAIPFALYFLILVVAATLGGILPALLAIVSSVVARALFPLPEFPLLPLSRADALRYGFLLTCAVIISFIGNRLQRSRRELEDALADLQDRNDALVESLKVSKCATWTYDVENDRGVRWYAGSYPVSGRPFEDLKETASVAPFLHSDDRAKLEKLEEHMRTSVEPIIFEYHVQWPDGEMHWLEMRAHRIRGSRNRWRGVTFDITERKRTEAVLLRSEKLAAMGRLASTVAHEINNPLEAVTNLLYLASGSSEPTQSYISMAERELARLANITRLTLGFVRSSAKMSDVDVARAVEDVLSIFQHRLENNNVQVRRHYEPQVLIAIAPHELRQVITNIIANAADALATENPILTVTVAREEKQAVLLVEDNGCGIPEQNMLRIFEPFFTTKAEVGTGIGLWVTREILDRNKGTVTVESGNLAPDVITRFRVEFPLSESMAEKLAA